MLTENGLLLRLRRKWVLTETGCLSSKRNVRRWTLASTLSTLLAYRKWHVHRSVMEHCNITA